jgi:hypothetical protein
MRSGKRSSLVTIGVNMDSRREGPLEFADRVTARDFTCGATLTRHHSELKTLTAEQFVVDWQSGTDQLTFGAVREVGDP